MIRVLQVVGGLDYGGIEAVIVNYYRRIDRDKVQFDFITTSAGGRFEPEIRALGGRIFTLPRKSKHPFAYMKQLRKVIAENRYDIVHSNTNSASAFLDLRPAKRAGCKVRIAHSHNTSCLVKWQHYLFKPLLPTVVTHRFACSDAAAKWLFGKRKDYVLLNNGVDADRFAFRPEVRADVRRENGWDGAFVLGNVASFQERKNQRFLIGLLPALRAHVPAARLVLVGSGGTESELRELARERGVADCVEFFGNRTDVDRLLNGFDVFCLPSLFEGLSVAYIEAAANGLPVLVSDRVPSVRIGDKIAQLPLEEALWTEKLCALADVPVPRASDRQALIDAGFDIATNARRLEELYLTIAEEHA